MMITQGLRRIGRTIILTGLAGAAGLSLFAAAAAPASAQSFGVWESRGGDSAYYNDKADTLLVCDRIQSSLEALGGAGVTAWLGVQQEDGSWRRFPGVHAHGKCVKERTNVLREAARVRITLCQGSAGVGYSDCKSEMRTGR